VVERVAYGLGGGGGGSLTGGGGGSYICIHEYLFNAGYPAYTKQQQMDGGTSLLGFILLFYGMQEFVQGNVSLLSKDLYSTTDIPWAFPLK
jgi:hypothetical protein